MAGAPFVLQSLNRPEVAVEDADVLVAGRPGPALPDAPGEQREEDAQGEQAQPRHQQAHDHQQEGAVAKSGGVQTEREEKTRSLFKHSCAYVYTYGTAPPRRRNPGGGSPR